MGRRWVVQVPSLEVKEDGTGEDDPEEGDEWYKLEH